MPYSEILADRIRVLLGDHEAQFREIKMMGGLCFMVDEKMCCGVLMDKKSGDDFLMARIGPDAYESALDEKGCHPMDFTGRPMKGYVFIDPEGHDTNRSLDKWLKRCLAFNPLAKASKKKKKKSK